MSQPASASSLGALFVLALSSRIVTNVLSSAQTPSPPIAAAFQVEIVVSASSGACPAVTAVLVVQEGPQYPISELT